MPSSLLQQPDSCRKPFVSFVARKELWVLSFGNSSRVLLAAIAPSFPVWN